MRLDLIMITVFSALCYFWFPSFAAVMLIAAVVIVFFLIEWALDREVDR